MNANAKSRSWISKTLIYVFLSLWALTTIFPFAWVIMSSFKPTAQIVSSGTTFKLPESFDLTNYSNANSHADNMMGWAYFNSIVISGTVTLTVLLLASIAAYGMARYKFFGKGLVQGLIIASMMIPVFGTIIPVFKIISSLKLVDNNFGVALPQIAGNMSFAIIVLIGYLRGMSNDIEEAAYIEGCNIFQIFFRIVLPLARPALATVAIFTFIWSYNDLFTQLFFLRQSKHWAITILLNQVNSRAGVNYGLLCATIVIVVVPILILYVMLQKNIIKGMTAGAVKG